MVPLSLDSLRWLRAILLGVALSIPFASARAQSAPPPPYVFSHLAGPLGGYGNADGLGSAARFTDPFALAVDRDGNVYVADAMINRIRKVGPTGLVSTVAGSDVFGQPWPQRATFIGRGIAVDGDGTLYYSNYELHTIHKITADGVVTIFAGKTTNYMNTSLDGSGEEATFWGPQGLALDAAGNLYVADTVNHLIRKITPAGVVSTFAGMPPEYGHPRGAGVSRRFAHPGAADGTGASAQFRYPVAVAVDGTGNVYVADEGNHTIRKITPAGVVTTLAGAAGEAGYADGTGAAARFNTPRGVVVDSGGNVYVGDTGNFAIRRITPAGAVTTFAGLGGAAGSVDGAAQAARFFGPNGLAIDAAGHLHLADGMSLAGRTDNAGTIRKISPSGVVSTLAGLAGARGGVDGRGAAARFDNPHAAVVDTTGNVYVADENNHVIRKITPDGVAGTFAGKAGEAGAADGDAAAARFKQPTGIAIDAQGNLYVADNGNSTVRKITPGGVVSTLAGVAGSFGTVDGTGGAARFHHPLGIAVDGAGTVYVTDGDYIASGDPAHQYGTIRKVTADGKVTTLAGDPTVVLVEQGFYTNGRDGTGAEARFSHPAGITIDAEGVLFVADPPTRKIRRITPQGVATTLTGLVDETGNAAEFRNPTGIAIDATGHLFVTDTLTHQVHRITPDGIVSTIAGTVEVKGGADGLGEAAQFHYPAGISVDSAGNLYVADMRNNAIRKGQRADAPVIANQPQNQTVDSGAPARLSVTAHGQPEPAYQWYLNGQPYGGATGSTLEIAAARAADAGEYTVVVSNALGSVTSEKAVLTVRATGTSPAPAPSGATGNTGSSGGGSSGLWFCGALALLGVSRRLRS